MLLEISRHYYTEVSTRNLAAELLGAEKLTTKSYFVSVEKRGWTMVAYYVLLDWASADPSPHSTTLLKAMIESSTAAAIFFYDALTCGEYLFFTFYLFLVSHGISVCSSAAQMRLHLLFECLERPNLLGNRLV